jgi:hypothetical protein
MATITHAPTHPLSGKRSLQAAVALAACVPVAAGLDGVLEGAAMVDASGASLDSHLRYLSGLLLGLGLLFWSAIPHIERRTALVRALTLMVVIGGVARALSLLEVGLPSTAMRFALIMELVVTPALCLWQSRVARSMDGRSDPG